MNYVNLIHSDGGYNKGSGGPGIKKGFLNDLAILVLDSPLNFTEGVKSISLDSSCSEMFEQNVTIGGWGITEKRQNTIPTGIVLKKVTLPLYAPTDKPSKAKTEKVVSISFLDC